MARGEFIEEFVTYFSVSLSLSPGHFLETIQIAQTGLGQTFRPCAHPSNDRRTLEFCQHTTLGTNVPKMAEHPKFPGLKLFHTKKKPKTVAIRY